MHIAGAQLSTPSAVPPRELIVGEPGSSLMSGADPRFAQYKVIRRTGSVVAFEPSKITIAMTKAFLAINGGQGAASARVREQVGKLTEGVVAALVKRKPEGGAIHIEEIQDQVELALMRAGEHQAEWYVRLTRRAVVPTLIDGDIVVPESNVINEYLDERFSQVPLSPKDPLGRARMRLWTKQPFAVDVGTIDRQIQFVHEDDVVEGITGLLLGRHAGAFNVAGDGVLMLSQALRRIQRASVSLPSFAVGNIGSVLRSARVADFSPEQLSFITYGRGVDTTRMREVLGFEPAYTTAEAFYDFGASLTPTGGRSVRALDGLTRALAPHESRELAGADRG